MASVHTPPQEAHPGNRRILLVEDNTVNRELMNTMLRRLGHQVVEAHNGRQAIDRLSRERFDLVFMDCQMPIMDGYEATRCVRNGEAGDHNRTIPILALTAHAMKGDRETCI